MGTKLLIILPGSLQKLDNIVEMLNAPVSSSRKKKKWKYINSDISLYCLQVYDFRIDMVCI